MSIHHRTAATLLGLSLLLLIPTVPSEGARFAWVVETVDTGNPTGLHTSLVLDKEANPRILYIDQVADALKYAVFSEGAWTSETIAAQQGFLGATELVLDDTDRPHLSFFSSVTGFVNYATWNGSGWNVHRVDLSHSEGYSTLAVDDEGRVHLAYAYFNGTLTYSVGNGTDWTSSFVDPGVITSRYISLALDSLDRPHIAYYGLGEVRYAVWNGRDWAIEVVQSGRAVGWFSRIALDATDTPHLVYRDSDEKQLKHAERRLRGWVIETVDATGDAGWDIDIATDSLNGVHLSYYERLGGELRYAYRAASTWQTSLVDTEGVVGWFTSLALDSEGRPHISYHDWSRGALKYATGVVRLEVKTLEADEISTNSARLRGELISLGEYQEATVSFAWRGVGAQAWNETAPQRMTAEGRYEAVLPILIPERAYEYRAQVEVAEGVEFGEILTFETVPEFLDRKASGPDLVPLFLIVGVFGFFLAWMLYFVVEWIVRKRAKS